MTDPAPRRSRLRGRAGVLVGVCVALLVVVALLPSPYAIEQPGPVFNTLGTTKIGKSTVPVVTVSGSTKTYPATGALDALTVSVVGDPTNGTPNWVELARAWFTPGDSVVPLEEIYPPDTTSKEAAQQDAQQMSQSQQDAIAAALLHLGYDVKDDLKVSQVVKGYPAAGRLRAGDEITSAGGAPVACAAALQQAVAKHGSGTPLSIGVERSGTASTVEITPRTTGSGSSEQTLLGIGVSDSFTFPVDIRLRLGDVGGPSAGMMFALGIIDKLTPGSLTGGKHVAGTGTIDCTGTVGPIGGIRQKMVAARNAGATEFLAPKSDCDEVVGHIPGGLRVFAVSKLTDSLAVLQALRSGASTAGFPTCEPR